MTAFYIRALSPKEFVAAVGGLISLKTARLWCRLGKLPTVNGPERPPYLIKAETLMKYRQDVSHLIVKDDSRQ